MFQNVNLDIWPCEKMCSKVCEWFAAPEADANGMMPMQKNAVSPLSIGPLQKVAAAAELE